MEAGDGTCQLSGCPSWPNVYGYNSTSVQIVFRRGPDRFYIDDVLTAHEEEVICGVYYVYTGKTLIELYIL